MGSDEKNAKALLQIIYKMVTPEKPYTLSIAHVIHVFHSEGGKLPSNLQPMDLSSAKRFFAAIEAAAGVVSIEELTSIAAASPGASAFESNLQMLCNEAEMPVIPACYVIACATEQLRESLTPVAD